MNKEVPGMIISNPSVLIPEATTVDISEARWAVEYLSLMIDKLGPESSVSLVLMQARRELKSLTHAPSATVIGPHRIAA
jgi:hypothetical protein